MSWLSRQYEAAAEAIHGPLERERREAKKALSEESNRVDEWYQKALGPKYPMRKTLVNDEFRYEIKKGGRWITVPNPLEILRKKNKEVEMAEDKSKGKAAGKKEGGPVTHKGKPIKPFGMEWNHLPDRPMGQKNKKGGPMFAEDDFPIAGMNPSSAPMSGGMDLSAPSVPPSTTPAGPGEAEALSGAKWAEPILKAIPGNRSDLMGKAMKLIGQLGEILAEAGYTEGGSQPGVEGAVPPQGVGTVSPKGTSPASPPASGPTAP